MKIKNIVDEDFVNYKMPSMFIGLGDCDWKCCKEADIPIAVCHNNQLAQQRDVNISADEIFSRYINNPISKAVVIGGLEPLTEWYCIRWLITYFRLHDCNDNFVIYTGYNKDEIINVINDCKKNFNNIIFKFGRFKPNQNKHFDDILGVYLISDNQYAEVIC